jgi:hypothetical protein
VTADYQAAIFEFLQSLADGDGTDAESLHEFAFDQTLARTKLSRDDVALDHFDDLFP